MKCELFKPKQDKLDYGGYCGRVRYVFSIVNNAEFYAATTMITAPDIEDGSDVITSIDDAGVFIGMMGRHPVGLIRHEPGSGCVGAITKGIRNFPNAEYLVAVGVCYGFCREKTKLADVLISNEIIDFGDYKIEKDGSVQCRSDSTTVLPEIKNIFCLDPDQVQGLKVAPDRNAKHFVKKIASCTNLVNNKVFRDAIYAQTGNSAYGGEMEGGKLMKLQKEGMEMPHQSSKKYIQVIVIKAVVDYADGEKTDEWQSIGAQAAFHYVKSKMKLQNGMAKCI